MQLCVFEDEHSLHFKPLVHTRPVYDLRAGIGTLLESIIQHFDNYQVTLHVRRELAALTHQQFRDLPVNLLPEAGGVLFINGRFLPEEGELLQNLRRMSGADPGCVFVHDDAVVAAWVPDVSTLPPLPELLNRGFFEDVSAELKVSARMVSRIWHLVEEMPQSIRRGFRMRLKEQLGNAWPGASIREGAIIVERENVFLAPGAVVRPGAILNAEDGPIYIDRDAIVMEGAIARGPLYLGPHGELKIGVRAESVSVGTYGKIGGEVKDSIIHSYSNKAHDGYLGNSYIGQWCNIGADSNTSNLKNDYSNVSLYNEVLGEFEDTGRLFVGLFMADHSKCGINTMFNTGTVVGVSCNIFNSGFPPRYIPSFSWGGSGDLAEYHLKKALQVAEAMMTRRGLTFTDVDRALLTRIFYEAGAARKSLQPKS